MRLHVLVPAAVAGVPFLALPYAGKVSAFAEAVDFPPPAPVHRTSTGPLLAEIDRMWDERDRRSAQLRRRMPALKQRASASIAVLALLRLPERSAS